MKGILSFGALALACAAPNTAHAQSGSPPAGHGEREAAAQDHSRHQASPAGAGQHGAGTASGAPHRMGMQDCTCCCCEAMRKKMREHGQGAAEAGDRDDFPKGRR